LKVGARAADELAPLLESLRQRITVSSDEVGQLCRDLGVDAVVVCRVAAYDPTSALPMLTFHPEFTAWVAKIGADIDVEVGARVDY
jgi:hypothetical protein